VAKLLINKAIGEIIVPISVFIFVTFFSFLVKEVCKKNELDSFIEVFWGILKIRINYLKENDYMLSIEQVTK
jgi:hypothetical protein